MALACTWDREFALLPPALADRKLCEYTRVLQLSALEQRVYASIDGKPDTPKPVGLWKKYLAWLTVVGITLYPMCVPQPPARRSLTRAPSPARIRHSPPMSLHRQYAHQTCLVQTCRL